MSQQRILELETELTKPKPPKGTLFCPSRPQAHIKYTRHDSHPSSTTRTLHYDSTFEPSPLLVVPGTVSTWPEENQLATDSNDSNYYKYIMARRLQTIPQPKMDALDKNLQKALQCWQNQPDAASKTIHRVSLAMGLEPHKLKKSTTDELVIKVMTAALTLSSLLASYLRSSCLIAKQI